jgi:hypothetical protein
MLGSAEDAVGAWGQGTTAAADDMSGLFSFCLRRERWVTVRQADFAGARAPGVVVEGDASARGPLEGFL